MSGRTKGSIVERYNRTLKTRLERYFTETKSHKWLDILPKMTKNINNSVNRSTGFKPVEVTEKNAEEIKHRLYRSNLPKKCTISIGDRVRIIRDKHLFKKGYSQSNTLFLLSLMTHVFILDWSDSIYEITNREQSFGVCYYKVKNKEGDILNRSFYREELNLVGSQ